MPNWQWLKEKKEKNLLLVGTGSKHIPGRHFIPYLSKHIIITVLGDLFYLLKR